MTKNSDRRSSRYSPPTPQEVRERLRMLYLAASFVLMPRPGIDEGAGIAYQPSDADKARGVVAIDGDTLLVLMMMRDVFTRVWTGTNLRGEYVDALKSTVWAVRNALFGPPEELENTVELDRKLVAMGEYQFGKAFLAEVRAWRAENNYDDPDWFRLAMVYFFESMASVPQRVLASA